MINIHLCFQNNQVIRTWENNQYLRDQLEQKDKPTSFITTVTLENRVEVPVRIFLPPSFNENDNSTKYPLIYYVHSAPDTNTVTDSFNIGKPYIMHLYLKIQDI